MVGIYKLSVEKGRKVIRHIGLDVVFRKNSNRTLNRIATKNLNILRKLLINILKELTYLGRRI